MLRRAGVSPSPPQVGPCTPGQGPGDACKIAGSPQHPRHSPTKDRTMDVEHINAIGNKLADLSQRTLDLRGYL